MQHPGQVLAKSVILDRIAADTPDCTETTLKTHIDLRKCAITGKIGWMQSGASVSSGRPLIYTKINDRLHRQITLLEHMASFQNKEGKTFGRRRRPASAISTAPPAGVDDADPQGSIYGLVGKNERARPP